MQSTENNTATAPAPAPVAKPAPDPTEALLALATKAAPDGLDTASLAAWHAGCSSALAGLADNDPESIRRDFARRLHRGNRKLERAAALFNKAGLAESKIAAAARASVVTWDASALALVLSNPL